MISTNDRQKTSGFKKFSTLAAAISMLASLFILIGWLFDLSPFKRLIANMETTKPWGAVGFFATSVALLFLQQGKPKGKTWQHTIGIVWAGIALLIGGLTLLEYSLGVNFGFDHFLFESSVLAEPGPFPGRPVLLVSICLTILGLALLAFRSKARGIDLVVFAVFFAGMVVLINYSYGKIELTELGQYRPVPLPSALLLVLLSLGYLSARPQSQFMAPLASPLAGGSFVRRFLPAAILTPLILGWIQLFGESIGLYTNEFGRVLFSALNMLVFIGLVYWNVRQLNEMDLQHNTANVALRQSEERFRTLLNATPAGKVMVEPGGKIVLANASAESLFGYEPGQLTGKTIELLLPERFREQHPMFRRLFETEPNLDMSVTGRNLIGLRQDGSEFPAEISLTPIETSEGQFTLASITDIIERKRAEDEIRSLNATLEQRVIERTKQLEHERARWQRIVEGMAEEIWSCDAEGKMSLLNIGPSSMMGLEPFKDKSVEEIYQEVEILYSDGRSRPPDQSPLLRSLRGEVVRGEEIMRHRQTDIKRYRQYSSAPMHDETGAITGAVAVVRDITEQKQAKEVLSRYELLSASSKDIVLFVDRENLSILETNTAAINAYGYSRDELLKLNILDLRAPETRHLAKEQIAQANSGGLLFETTHIRKDGSTFPVEVSSQAATINGVRTLISVVRDITERKRADEALRESENRFRTLIESAPVAISLARDGNLIYANPRYAKIHGFESANDVVGHPALEHVAPQSRDKALARSRRRTQDLLADEEQYELIGLRKDGTEFPMLASVARLRLSDGPINIGFFQDITESKQLEDALRESEQKYTLLFEKSTVATALLLLPEVVIVDANEAFEKLTGYTRQEMFGKSALDLGLEERSKERAEAISQFERQGELTGKEAHLLTKNGEARIVVFNTSPIKIHGQPYAISTVLDVTERKQAEEEVRRSQQLLQAIIDNTQALIYVKDLDGRLIVANEPLAQVYGMNAQEVLGKTSREIVGDLENANAHMANDLQVLALGQPFTFEEFTPDRVFLSLKFPLRDAQGHIFAVGGVSTDITERKKTEEQLTKLTNRLRLATYAAHLGIWDWDIQKNESEWNEQMVALYGLKPGATERGYEVWLNGIHPKDRDLSQETVQQALRGEKEYNTEYRVLWPDGSVHWLKAFGQVFRNENGTPVRMLGVNYDITELKQAEIAIRESEERFSTAFHSSPVPQAIATQGTGEILVVNGAFCRLFEYSREELVGDTTTKLRLWETEADRESALKELRETGHMLPRETAIRTKSGKILVLIGSIEPISWKGISCAISSVIDITARKKAEEQIAASLKEKEVLLKEIHHRVKNNLQVISSLLRLQSAGLSDPTVRELFAESQRRVRAMALIHEQLYQSANLAQINLRDYITSLVNYLRHSYAQTISKVETQINVEDLIIEMDRAMPIGLLVSEVVSNSLKYAFSSNVEQQNSKIWVEAKQGKDGLTLMIGDNGVGLPEGLDIKHTTSMGLQLVDSFVTQLQGQLTVQREPGTVFTIFIPDKG